MTGFMVHGHICIMRYKTEQEHGGMDVIDTNVDDD